MSASAAEMKCPWGRGKTSYQDRDVPVDHKAYIGWFAATKDRGQSAMIEATGLNKKTVRRYKSRYLKGERQSTGLGRQYDVADSPAKEVKEIVEKAVAEDRALDTQEVGELLAAAVEKTSGCKKNNVSRKWVKMTMERIGLETKNAQEKTNARQEAERDVLNALSTIVGFGLVAKMVPDNALVINFDATQFLISSGKGNTLEVVVVKDEPTECPISTQVKGGGGLNYFIKYFSIISAGGLSGPLVFLVACADMTAEACEILECKGLCMSDADSDTVGYVAFCQTRCANRKFYKWLNLSVILPFIIKVRGLLGLAASRMAVVACDGEVVQIDPYQDPDVQAAFAAAFIFMMKLCASTTAVSQPCDAWKLFCLLKLAVAHMGNKYQGQVFLEDQLKRLFDAFGKGYKVKPSDRTRAIRGLLMIRKAVADYLRSSTILNSFKITGLRPFSIEQILQQFHYKPTAADIARVSDEMGPLVKKMARYGELADTDLMRFSVAKDAATRGLLEPLDKGKEQRVLHQRRIVLCLHKEVVEAELNRQLAASQAVKEMEAQKADKKRKREQNEAEKEARKVARLAKQAAKAAQVVRQASLPQAAPQPDPKGRRKRVFSDYVP